jgi:hypothetical protein
VLLLSMYLFLSSPRDDSLLGQILWWLYSWWLIYN